ncbi:MAG: hypothetical protein EWV75_17550 [Microcystis wesenbergii Mw_QC_S_20081001_S30D]|uniref:Uncharacterized protein n=1 Tax=Microcystis wesenbergii Mw_QC_S_20081001_S30D TaxID=2486245 RepID=A0A552JE21_9CHRO|nr:MAG: hypothetical protein EWV75_17550 [Microcystis wesenbergii Mw_QC_S_20081001_S30D]
MCIAASKTTQPCILREVVDRPNLGQKRPLRSKGHHHNLPDKTRTVAGVLSKIDLLQKSKIVVRVRSQ